MKKILHALQHFLKDRFNLNEDKADENAIVESIRKEVTFKGVNVWTLIFAIFIASIGLNVNSPAVIIGAMLISPLMGPIMGIGLGVGINDFDLLKQAAKNLLIAAIISIGSSFLYFIISPLHDASSELLARTNPSVWDVFIAFFGGLAGIVAGTRKEKSNVIPGVAIATALMPPLCTAGYGLATGKLFYFLGALYLFFINSLFICLATFLIVKHLKFHKKEFPTPERAKRVSRSILIIVIITTVPSVYLAYRIVEKSIFESNAKKFVQAEFHFQKTQVVTHNYVFDGKKRSIELLLLGQSLTAEKLDTLKGLLPRYNLYNTELIVYQGLNAKQEIDLATIKASILEDVFNNENKDETTAKKAQVSFPDIRNELKVLYPQIENYSIQQSILRNVNLSMNDTVTLITIKSAPKVLPKQQAMLSAWLNKRLKTDSLKIIFE
ncbi:MAG: TIGR00341 family protein [Bacteroidetes bacterium]|nr:TIGR00341 family protein [Bacteroidota bacterium]